MRFMLSVHCGHNASAAIGDETGLLYAAQEERFTGEKNHGGFPKQAVAAAMAYVGAKAGDLLEVISGSRQVFSRHRSRADVLAAYRRHLTLTGKLRQQLAMPLLIGLMPGYGQEKFADEVRGVGLGGIPIVHHDHHTVHATTAYYGLRRDPRERTLVMTCDGDGDGSCATVWAMGGGERQELSRTSWENSLGSIYSWVTFGMGFVPLEHEYKLMGMAPYASDAAARKAAGVFHGFLGLDDSGLRLKRKTIRRTNDIYEALFAELKGMRFDHVCAGLQRFTEDLLVQWTANAVRHTGLKRIVAGGGVFMNVKANKKLAELVEVESFEAFPSCGDETLPMGAFWMQAAKRWGEDRVPPLRDFYLGETVRDEDVPLELARRSGLRAEQPADLPRVVAELLVSGKPVARAAGRMEFGARALGNRSILADPKNSDVVRVINQMVKKRDFWMPFAPMVAVEHHDEVVQNPKRLVSPYMMMTFDTRENFRDLIAAVHNADLTCRAQLLARAQNPEMHDILTAFRAQTGRPVVLNTSFNLHGFPIVRTAKDALDVLEQSGLEHLIVGSYLVSKKS